MLYQKLKDFVGKPTAVDAGYKTPFIAKLLLEEQVRPVMTYQRPMTTRTTSREGYKQYVSNHKICKNCLALAQCTQSRFHTKQIYHHI